MSFWRDLPSSAWALIVATWLRVAALAVFAVSVGSLVDGVTTLATLVGVASLALAAGCAWFSELQISRVHADQEGTLRHRALLGIWSGVPAGPEAATRKDPADSSRGDHGRDASAEERARTGTQVALLTDSVASAANYRAEFLGPSFAALSAPLLVVAAIGWAIDGRLAALLGVLVIAVPVTTMVFGRLFRTSSTRYRKLAGQVAGRFQEALRSLGLLKLLGATQQGRRALASGADKLAQAMFAMLKRNQLMIIVNDVLFSAGLVTVVLAWVWHGYSGGALTAGQALAGVLLAVQLYEPIDSLGRTFYVGLGGRAQLARLNAVSSTTPMRGQVKSDRQPVALKVTDLSITRGGTRLFSGLNLTVAPGEVLAVVGPTGVGKSSLALALQGLLPYGGSISLGECPADSATLLNEVTMVAQHPYVFAGSVADNLRLASPDAPDAELWRVLEEVNLAGELPDGLDTELGEFGYGLSGGQLRRLALARALLSKTPILILDEPTADLDRHNEETIVGVLDRLRGTTTIIQIAHRLRSVRTADRVLVLSEVPHISTVSDLLVSEGYFAKASEAEGA